MTAMLALPASVALGQTKPPVAQFWADVATHSMSIPGMDNMDEGSMGMFGGFFGGTKNAGGAPGKWLDTALHTRNKPSGTLGGPRRLREKDSRTPLPGDTGRNCL